MSGSGTVEEMYSKIEDAFDVDRDDIRQFVEYHPNPTVDVVKGVCIRRTEGVDEEEVDEFPVADGELERLIKHIKEPDVEIPGGSIPPNAHFGERKKLQE